MSQSFPIVIAGGSSLVAPYLMKRLIAKGLVAEVISRRHVDIPAGFTFIKMDLTQARNWIAPQDAVIISLLPMQVLDQYLPRFIGVKAIIAVSSTSRFTKAKSDDVKERSEATGLMRGEELLTTWCRRSNVHCTLLRSTMIYDGINDNNIARIVKFIRRWHFLPVAEPAKGLRQPIHADDVANAIINSIGNEAVSDKSLNIAGSEVLSYRAMVERVFTSLGMKPRLLMLPTKWLEKAFRWGSDIGLVQESAFGSAIFQRMNEDLIFDVEEGLRLLNYQPRGFGLGL